jgi:hypothetical protein
MKKKFILLPLVGLLFYVLFSSSASGPGATGDGDRTGATGAPGCSGGSCHSTTATAAITVLVQLYDVTGTTLITSYVGGTPYKIRVTGTNTGATIQNRFGFQVTAVKTSSHATSEGMLAAIASTHLGTYSGINIVEHQMALPPTSGGGGMGTTYVVNIPWTAPMAGTGSVSLFAVINAVNGSGGADPGDLWNNGTLAVPEFTSSAVSPITGTLVVCTGATTTLTDATTGGTWSSNSTSIATIGTTGIVSGVAVGTATITYNVTGTGTATAVVTVNTVPAPAAITGPTVVCVTTHIILSDASASGAWSSAATTIASAGLSTGVITGVAVGTAVISYTVANTCGIASVMHTMTVKALGGTCVSGVSTIGNPLVAELKVYPNPNYGTFTLHLSSENNEQANVIITNIVGQRVKAFTAVTNTDMEIKLDQPAGIYFVTAATANGIYTAKIVVQ